MFKERCVLWNEMETKPTLKLLCSMNCIQVDPLNKMILISFLFGKLYFCPTPSPEKNTKNSGQNEKILLLFSTFLLTPSYKVFVDMIYLKCCFYLPKRYLLHLLSGLPGKIILGNSHQPASFISPPSFSWGLCLHKKVSQVEPSLQATFISHELRSNP